MSYTLMYKNVSSHLANTDYVLHNESQVWIEIPLEKIHSFKENINTKDIGISNCSDHGIGTEELFYIILQQHPAHWNTYFLWSENDSKWLEVVSHIS